jgi:hypothetical protein
MGVIEKAHSLSLNRNPSFSFDVHAVKHLIFTFPSLNGPTGFYEAVRKG